MDTIAYRMPTLIIRMRITGTNTEAGGRFRCLEAAGRFCQQVALTPASDYVIRFERTGNVFIDFNFNS